MATLKYGTLELVPAPEVGLTLESRFFGADIRFSRSKTYSLRGTILDQTNLSGISGIYTRQDQIVTGFQSHYQPFIIDGVVIGYPQIKNISFDSGPLVYTNKYTIDLEILESGNPFQITGVNYGFTGVTGLFHNIESLSESLDYDTDFKTFNYNHTVDVVYRTGFNIDPLLNAKIIASGLINSKSAFPFITSGSISGQKTYEERTSVFGGSYGVTERFKGTTGNLTYEHLYTLNLQLGENGITTVSQQGTINGFDPNKYLNAQNGYNTIKSDIYSECSGFYASQLSGLLNNTYLTDSRTDDINAGSIQYSRSFTDESGVSDVRWQFTHQTTKENNSIAVSEQGSVVGLGHASVHFAQASGYYNTNVRPGVTNRVLAHISGFGQTGNVFLVSREQGFNEFNGTIDYSFGYSNNPSVGAGSGIKRFSVTINDELPMHNRVAFNIVGAGTLIQSLSSTSAGTRTVNVDTQAFRDTPRETGLRFTQDKVNLYRPTGVQFIDPFISSLSVGENPIENRFNASVTFTYGGYREDLSLRI